MHFVAASFLDERRARKRFASRCDRAPSGMCRRIRYGFFSGAVLKKPRRWRETIALAARHAVNGRRHRASRTGM